MENFVEKKEEKITKEKEQKPMQSSCLRCGYCCYHWAVADVPGITGGYKEQFENCPHLREAQIVDGAWQVASCPLHGRANFPAGCSVFNIVASEGVCLIGLQVWKDRSSKGNLPKEIFNFLEKRRKK